MSVRKFTVANDELGLRGKYGLYCFLPYARIDSSKKAVFKCGMTTQEFAKRIEDYHSYYPLGAYICFTLSVKTYAGELKEEKVTEMEKMLFEELKKEGAKMMEFPSRPHISWDFRSEWFYTSYIVLKKAFTTVEKAYPGSVLESHPLGSINRTFEAKVKKPNTYLAEIVYTFV